MEKIVLTNIVIDWQDDNLLYCFTNLAMKAEQGKLKIVGFLDGMDGSKALPDKDFSFALKAIAEK